MKYYYDRNGYIIDDPYINPAFYELLLMTNSEFECWVDAMRTRVLQVWNECDIPPLGGQTEQEMEETFREMSGTPGIGISMYKAKSGGTKKYVDELDGQQNVIINDGYLGSCVNQFFPHMAKAKINYQTKVDENGAFKGYAVYDLFANDRFRNRMQKGCLRHFRRDSFYRYSASIAANSHIGLVPASTGKQWVQIFKRDFIKFKDYGYWLNRVEPPEEGEVGTGYTQVDASKFLWLSKSEILELVDFKIITPENCTNLIASCDRSDLSDPKILRNVLDIDLKDSEQYHIRFFKKDTRIFPVGFTAFKIGYIQVAVNFPPMIAKYLYEKYTDHCKDQDVINIYDPSAGWGGRIAGAMTVLDDRHVHYIGTDPSTENVIPELGVTRYEYLADFINRSLNWHFSDPHTYEVFRLGSEVIGDDPAFKKYKGKLDLVFTSPPYFSKEQYSNDKTQSCLKFPHYQEWVNGFLKPTLEIAVSYLKNNRYLLWNVADVFYDGGICLPLESDSSKILNSLGMEFIGVERMCLANMPGQNRISEDGTPSCKNYVKVNGKFRKYEPIFVFRKP